MKNLELKIPPLILVLLAALAMWALALLAPEWALSHFTSRLIAAICGALGSLFCLLGVLAFRRANTTVDPRYPEKAACLVVVGIYGVSRNPMYLGFLFMLLGFAFFLQNYAAFIVLPFFIIYLQYFQIRPEERYMQEKFGDDFTQYTARVRRWL